MRWLFPSHQIIKEATYVSKLPVKTITYENVVTSKKFILDDRNSISLYHTETTYLIEQRRNQRTGLLTSITSRTALKTETKKETFNLEKVTADDLYALRKEKIASFVLKENDNLFCAQIPERTGFLSTNFLGEHKCNYCRHLSSASDEDGGCAKVRNFACFIENYPWITFGYETFSCKDDAFVVIKCEHFETEPPRKTKHSDS